MNRGKKGDQPVRDHQEKKNRGGHPEGRKPSAVKTNAVAATLPPPEQTTLCRQSNNPRGKERDAGTKPRKRLRSSKCSAQRSRILGGGGSPRVRPFPRGGPAPARVYLGRCFRGKELERNKGKQTSRERCREKMRGG